MTISPCLTRRLCRTTRFIRALPSSRSSSASTMRTVSFRFLPLTKTVSPRNSCRVSIVLFDRAMMELSSLTASVTLEMFVSMALGLARSPAHSHERIRLLLLFQYGRSCVIDLYRRLVSSNSRDACELLTSFFSAPEASLTPQSEAAWVLDVDDTHLRLAFPLDGALLTKSGSADMLMW